jgi:hypothetical protein
MITPTEFYFYVALASIFSFVAAYVGARDFLGILSSVVLATIFAFGCGSFFAVVLDDFISVATSTPSVEI